MPPRPSAAPRLALAHLEELQQGQVVGLVGPDLDEVDAAAAQGLVALPRDSVAGKQAGVLGEWASWTRLEQLGALERSAQVFLQAFQTISRYHAEGLPDSTLWEAAIEGLLENLNDPYATVLTPAEYGPIGTVYSYIVVATVLYGFGLETAFLRFAAPDRQLDRPHVEEQGHRDQEQDRPHLPGKAEEGTPVGIEHLAGE